MGLFYNPSVVLDGLLLMLDPANTKSYPGSGTLTYNLINSASINMNSVAYSSSFSGCYSLSGSSLYSGDMDALATRINGLSAITVCMWVKRNRVSLAGSETIFAINRSGVHAINISFLSSNQLYGGGRSGTDTPFQSVTTNQRFDRNKFIHVTLTMNLVSKQTKLYVDGFEATVTGTTNYASTVFSTTNTQNRIGDEITLGVAPFYGLISQVLVYNRELNSDEIFKNYNATKGRFISKNFITSDNLVVSNDVTDPLSYPGTGNTWYNGVGVTNHSTMTNVVYNSSGYMDYNGTAYTYADIANLNVRLEGPYSINVWTYWNGTGTDIIDIGSSNNLHQLGYLNGLTLWKFGGTPLATTTMDTGKWMNIAYTIDNYYLKLYKNGELVFSNTVAGLSGLCDQLLTGTFATGYANKYNGRISNFQVYNRVLSSSEIQENYTKTKARYYDIPDITLPGLAVACDAGYVNSYPGSGTNWFDISGNGITGTLTNGPVFVNSSDSPSIQFDATNDSVTFGTSSVVKPTTLSLGCIFKINAAPSTNVIVGKQGPNVGGASYALVIQSGSLRFRLEIGGTAYDASYPFVNQNTYIYAMGTADGNTLRLYINGVLVGSTSYSGSIVYSDSYPLLMGLYANTFATNMNIGAMQLYNRPLSAQEVLRNYNAYRGRYGL